MNKFEKKIYDEINGEKDNTIIKRSAVVAGIIALVGALSLISENTYDHRVGVSNISKLLSNVKLPNQELSLGAINQLQYMERDLKSDNANAYYYDYVTFENKEKISKDDYDNLKNDDKYSVLIEKEPSAIKVTNNLIDGINIERKDADIIENDKGISYVVPMGYELAVLNNYYLLDTDNNKNVYSIDYDKDNVDDIYLTNDYYYINNKYDIKKYDFYGNEVATYYMVEKGPKRSLKK